MGIRLSIMCLVIGLLPPLASMASEEPLAITPENCLILDDGSNLGAYLQYFLMKRVARHPDAESFSPLSKTTAAERAAAPAFPMIQESKSLELPSGKTVLSVGRTRLLTETVERNAFVVRRQGNNVLIAGDSRISTLSGLRWFLNHCANVRIYAPDSLWWSGPEGRRFEVGPLDHIQRACFQRAAWSNPDFPRNALWEAINTPLSGGRQWRASHTIANYFDPAKYFATHPGIYEMKANGNRERPSGRIWQPCFSAKELPEVAMEEIRGIMRQAPKTEYLSLAIMDIPCDCHCHDCVKSVRQVGHYGNLYFSFLNKVAAQCQKEFPELRLTAYLYNNVNTPTGMRLEPNIILDCARSEFMSYNWVDKENLEAAKAGFGALGQLGVGWLLHDWCFSGVTPREYTRQYATFLQWGAQNGMAGLYVEWTHGESWYLDGPKYWILRELMSDPYQDVDTMWKQYCADMYGDGAEAMFAFFRRFSDKYIYSSKYISRSDLPRNELALFDASDLSYQEGLLAQAESLAGDGEDTRQRFTALRRYWEGHKLFVQAAAEPSRLDRQFRRPGEINRKVVAYYVNETGNKLMEAVDYYQHKRTIPPDSHDIEDRLGGLPGYISNYTRGKSDVVATISRQALEAVPAAVGEAAAASFVANCVKLFRAQLPPTFLPERVKDFESIFSKTAYVPTLATVPAIDGEIGTSEWSGAATLGDFLERDTLVASPGQTVCRLARVGDVLAIAITCQQPGGVWSRTTPDIQTGAHLWRESGVEVFLGPADQGFKNYAQYVINAQGAFRGFSAALDNRDGVRVAAKLGEDGKTYCIEALIPLKAGKYDFSAAKTLYFNIARNVFTRDSYAADSICGWHPIFYTPHNPGSMGLIFLD